VIAAQPSGDYPCSANRRAGNECEVQRIVSESSTPRGRGLDAVAFLRLQGSHSRRRLRAVSEPPFDRHVRHRHRRGAGVRTMSGRETGSVVVLAEDRHAALAALHRRYCRVLPWHAQRHVLGLTRFVARAAECS
jgi:hypothetical protein